MLLRPSQEPRRDGAAGFTLIEIIVVLAIVGLVMVTAVNGFKSITRSDLRTSAGNLSGALRYLFDRASTTGRAHRLVIDIDAGRYWAETSDDRFFVPREKETEAKKKLDVEATKKELETEKTRMERIKAAGYDLTKLEPEDFKPRRARFAAFKEMAIKPQNLKRGAKISAFYTPRLPEPIGTGRAYVYFFPMGQTEPAIIHVTDAAGENTYSLVLHPLTGRVKIYNYAVDFPAVERFDDEGTRVLENK